MRIKALHVGIFAAATTMFPASLAAQSDRAKAQTFALGVNAGLASTQIHEPFDFRSDGRGGCTYRYPLVLFKQAITDSRTLAADLIAQGVQVDSPPDWAKFCVRPPEPIEVEAWRTATQVKLNKQSAASGAIFALGINIGIAEAQASLGESRRHIVFLALNNALTGAKAVGMDTAELNETLLLVNGTTPMADIHNKLVLIRTTYQATF